MPETTRLIVELRTFCVAIAGVDAAEKAGGEFERAEMNDLGGLALHFSGSSSALRSARDAISELAERFCIDAVSCLIDRPSSAAVPFIDLQPEFQPLLNQFSINVPAGGGGDPTYFMKAIGIVETQGFTAITAATDAATKAADVTVIGREKLGGGYIAVIFEGNVAAVESAVSAAKSACERFDALIASEVIARPSDGVDRLLQTVALPPPSKA